MLHKISKLLSLMTLLFLFAACTGNEPVKEGEGAKIIGTVTYDRVPVKVDSFGTAQLNYAKTYPGTGKHLVVKAIDENSQTLAQTTTNNLGQYTLYVPENTAVKIRVYARMFKEGAWDLSVVDNTNLKSNYVIEGDFHDSGTQTTKIDLHAASGWDGQAYSMPRDAAPFAILDSINTIMQKIVQASPDIKFPHLLINWSVNNVSVGGDPSLGQIGTSSYTAHDGNMWILGDANADTDEYDDHIIIHEWSHFFEDKFSRSDSIGGSHSSGDALDIRVAFGEGFANAMSAIATDNPIYFDTSGYAQSSGWYMNIETAQPENPGWFSEASIQRILYDLYDDNSHSHADGDHAHLGFKPIFNTMVDKERNAKAFTSIFTFIHALKNENPSKQTMIDQTVASEQINTIHDIYGNYRSNTANGHYTQPLYRTLETGKWITQCNKNNYGVYNKLGNRTYVKISIPSDGVYTFGAKPYGSSYGDPDLVLYETGYPYEIKGMSPLEGESSDSLTMDLKAGNYMLEVYDNSFQNSCFVINLDKGYSNTTYMGKMTKGSGASKPIFNNQRRPLLRPIEKQ
ncbi:MAG TPA: hypothetical protein ENK82_06310 [Campylobacterales bacterium]|nr:hypothetical protein [Campylobacterales bacterium]HHS92943.1 hypothetical protein [Campylobacterales bacterium]